MLPAQDQARQHYSIEDGRAHKTAPLAEEIVKINGFQKGQSQVFFMDIASSKLTIL